MSIAIISTKTGNGHNSVMNTISTELQRQEFTEVSLFPTFYEDLMMSNKILSDFYNFLMITSTELCNKFSELSTLVRPDLSEDFYNGIYDKVVKFLKENKFKTIISTSHTLNHAFIRILKELGLEDSIGYYVVITDPFNPISVGFAPKDAKKYYCGSDIVKNILIKSGIEGEKIVAVDYPVNEKFLKTYLENEIDEIYSDLNLYKDKRTILINSGSQGVYHYIKFLKTVSELTDDVQIIFIAGKNKALFDLANRSISKDKLIRIFGYVDNIEKLMKISDIIITKSGANAFYEGLFMEKPMIIDGVNGFLFQERGVLDFLNKNKVGIVINDEVSLKTALIELLDSQKYNEYKENIRNLKLVNGVEQIVNDILKTESYI